MKEHRISELKLQLEEYKILVHGSRSERYISGEIAEQLSLELAVEAREQQSQQPQQENTYSKKAAVKPKR